MVFRNLASVGALRDGEVLVPPHRMELVCLVNETLHNVAIAVDGIESVVRIFVLVEPGKCN